MHVLFFSPLGHKFRNRTRHLGLLNVNHIKRRFGLQSVFFCARSKHYPLEGPRNITLQKDANSKVRLLATDDETILGSDNKAVSREFSIYSLAVPLSNLVVSFEAAGNIWGLHRERFCYFFKDGETRYGEKKRVPEEEEKSHQRKSAWTGRRGGGKTGTRDSRVLGGGEGRAKHRSTIGTKCGLEGSWK